MAEDNMSKNIILTGGGEDFSAQNKHDFGKGPDPFQQNQMTQHTADHNPWIDKELVQDGLAWVGGIVVMLVLTWWLKKNAKAIIKFAKSLVGIKEPKKSKASAKRSPKRKK